MRLALVIAGAAAIVLGAVGTPLRAGAQDGACNPGQSAAITNGGFEAPAIGPSPTYRIFAAAGSGAVWGTTATDGQVEYWRTNYRGVPAFEGAQFAELNANLPSALYQDVQTVPGEVYNWRLAHRGRSGVDTMALRIGPVGSTVEVARMTTGNTAWQVYEGTYTVPAGQTVTRFEFAAVSTATGSLSIGNFLDGIAFTPCALPPVTTTTSSTTTTTSTVPPSTTTSSTTTTTSTVPPSTTTSSTSTTTSTVPPSTTTSSTTTSTVPPSTSTTVPTTTPTTVVDGSPGLAVVDGTSTDGPSMEPLFDPVATSGQADASDSQGSDPSDRPTVSPAAASATPDSLAFTGGGSVPLVLAGVVLVLLGLVLGAGRRRSA
jgi:hypothetical protein